MDDMQRYLKEREKSSETIDILKRKKIRHKEISSVVFNTIIGIWVLLAIWHIEDIVHYINNFFK